MNKISKLALSATAISISLSSAAFAAESVQFSAQSISINPTNYSGASEETEIAFEDEFATELEVNDPLEPFNRAVFAFNDVFDDVLLEPVAVGYKSLVPEWGRDRVSNALGNLAEPVNFVNATLQAKDEAAFTSLWRFLINSTFGLLGTFDAASEVGLKRQSESFGQTLYAWGVDESPYLVLPIFGPSTLRDGSGAVVDYFVNPFNYDSVIDTEGRVAIAVTTAIDVRSDLLDTTDKIEAAALDPYVAYRSFYLQNFEKRAKE